MGKSKSPAHLIFSGGKRKCPKCKGNLEPYPYNYGGGFKCESCGFKTRKRK